MKAAVTVVVGGGGAKVVWERVEAMAVAKVMSEIVEARCNLKHHEQHERHERECATCGLHGEVCVGCTERFVGAEGCARRRRQLWRGGSLARRRGMAWQDGWRMRCGSDAPNSEYDGLGVPRAVRLCPELQNFGYRALRAR